MKKHIFKNGLVASVLIAIILIFSIFPNESTKREKYENYLNNQFENIEEFSKEELKEMPKPTRPDLAAIQNYYMTLDPELGRVPLERLVDAYHETKLQINQARLKSSEQIEWENLEVEMGGRTRALMWDPNDDTHKKVWAGAAKTVLSEVLIFNISTLTFAIPSTDGIQTGSEALRFVVVQIPISVASIACIEF